MEANQKYYSSPKEFFDTFTESVYSGTINEEGLDPSGLYWLPKRVETANMLLSALNGLSDWLYEEYGAAQLNPWRKAKRYEERLNWMAQINKSQNSFLGHLNDVHEISETAKLARNAVRRKIYTHQKEIQKPSPRIKYINSYGKGLRIQERTIN